MVRNCRVFCFALVALVLAWSTGSRGAEAKNLEAAFARPPASARPHTWWHWMNGNITKEGITADLEAMAEAGVGGAQIFNAGCGIPAGPVTFGTDKWYEMIRHAGSEARRLGIELCIHNCAGWSSSGGPWNTPEHGMKVVVTSETKMTGPTAFEGKLAAPPSKLDWYRDIAVLAFPTPVGERVSMLDVKPTVTVSTKGQDATKLVDGKTSTSVSLRMPAVKKYPFIEVAFPEPFMARSLTLRFPGTRSINGKLEVSDDGQEFRTIAAINIGRGMSVSTTTFDSVTAKIYRAVFTSADRKMKRLSFSELELSPQLYVGNVQGKTFLVRGGNLGLNTQKVSPRETIQRDTIVDLTSRLQEDGSLKWAVPEGEWTVLRVGYTPNGRKNHPAPEGGSGLECDKLSREAAQAHWDGMMGRILKELGPLAGHPESGLNNVLIDSYEVGCQNWTQGFGDEFRKRRGYDLLPFLPAFTGRVVESPEVTGRFLWDLRRTIADLFAENYSGAFAEMAHKAGLQYSVEPYGNGPHDDLQYGSYCDIPMGEFWTGRGVSAGNAKLPASVAHVYGKKYVGAEAFTASPEGGRWLTDPYALKAQGDAVYCGGVNRMIYHRYAHQPWTNRFPGMTMGQWGTHFERTVTWWEQGRDWLAYQARCQYLLQEGLFVGDVVFYCGEGAPNGLRRDKLPAGYDYDGCDTRALMLMSVKDGRVILPSGMSYSLLVLPKDKSMTPGTLRKIQELVAAGAKVIGPKPERSPSLADYPACDAEVGKLADTLWPEKVADQSPTEALVAMGIKPDFECLAENHGLLYIHRNIDGAEVYFVASHEPMPVDRECTFRVAGMAPELWHPDTGKTEAAPIWREEDGRTTVQLHFDPAGSVFVVFRSAATTNHAVALREKIQEVEEEPVYELKIIKAEYGAFDQAAGMDWMDVTEATRQALASPKKTVEAGNHLAGDPVPNVPKEMLIEYVVNGEAKKVKIAEHRKFKMPEGGKLTRAVYGLIEEPLPQPPKTTMEITEKLAAKVKNGKLRVKVDNALSGKDPAYLIVKELRVDYLYRGERKQVRIRENAVLALPQKNARYVPPKGADLVVGEDGLALHVWQAGQFEVDTPAGKTWKYTATNLPKAVELSGSWTVRFPPNWGAPEKIQLNELKSWTDHPADGVKYFSGTGTYAKTFGWNGRKQAGERYVLDLGDLRNLAEVTLNGTDLGVLWKPPFRLDVTDCLRSGNNVLQVKITNMWPNRLIGDERLREPDCEWRGLALKEWPQWFLDGKPSPTGRLTFTTWHHWMAKDEPLVSGLLGPVTIRPVKVVAVR